MSIGEKLRRIRQARGISVRSLAKKVGVSPSLISQIEHGYVTPSYSTLKSLGEALDEDPSQLTEDKVPLDWILVRKDARRRIFTGQDGVSLELFAFPGPRDKRMEAYLVHLSPGAIFTAKPIVPNSKSDEQDDFLFVISGKIEVTTDRRSYLVDQDEACYLTYERIQSLSCKSPAQASVLWCVCRSKG